MYKKTISLALIGLILNLAFFSTAMANTETDAKFAEKIKANIAKLGTGKDSKVEIKLKDGTKIKGYVSEIRDSSFVVENGETGASIEIPYPQVKQAKGSSKTKNIIITTVLVVGLLVLLSFGAARGN